MAFSTAVRKARDFAERSRALATAPRRMISPRADRPGDPCDAILVLQRGANASTDYYLRPRLERETRPWAIIDLDDDPAHCRLLQPRAGARALLVVFCRYASRRWLDALGELGPRVARAALFVDDDLPAVLASHELPRSVRGKLAANYGAHVARLEELCSELWVSTPELARRYAQARPVILDPAPDADPPAPSRPEERRVVYHGTDTHSQERAFALEVARRLAALACPAHFEITGGASVRAAARGLETVEVAPQLPWPEYRRVQGARQAAIMLGPLAPTPVNGARAPVKVFDAARLGATGLYADAPPYRGFVRDGVDGLLLPMEPQAWAAAIRDLLNDPLRRRALAEAARVRLVGLRASLSGLPAAAA